MLFAPLAFAPQSQYQPRNPPSPLVFSRISTHFTATPLIPIPSARLKVYSFGCHSLVEPEDFTTDLYTSLRALYAQ